MKKNYLCNSRNYFAHLSIEQELSFEQDKNYLFDLSYLEIINVESSNAMTFLQGQLSADIRQVNKNTIRRSTLCNLQGRIIALMDVVNFNGLKLITPADLSSVIKDDLKKPALFSRVNLREENTFKIFGLYVQNKHDLPFGYLPCDYEAQDFDNKFIYNIGNNFYILLIGNDDEDLIKIFHANNQFRGSLAWHYLQLQNQNPEIYPESSGKFLPHRLNLHLKDYLSFNKGCYKGQEIIARMHFKSKTKYNLNLMRCSPDSTLHSAEKLKIKDKEMGEIIDFCPLDENGNYLILSSNKISE